MVTAALATLVSLMFYVDTHCDVGVRVGQNLKFVLVAKEEFIRLLKVNGRPLAFHFCILRHLINKTQQYNEW